MSASSLTSGDEKLRRYIEFLHEHDISKYIDLPEIAVMGDTSSGKSSLLSSLADIELPSSATITTRCPLRLRMSHDGKVRGSVGIKWIDGAPGTSGKIPWPTENVTDLTELPALIAKAQKCILAEKNDAPVAHDIIEVGVWGPDRYDLTLIDLPGIVRAVGHDEDPALVEEIHSLINKYLINERCVVMAVQPANVDFHNSQVMADAKKVDPQGNRTIPVITKPDNIDSGAEGPVMDLLLGKVIHFKHGFHMVKCRGQDALNKGVTLQDGQEEGERYFRTQAPWNESSSLQGSVGILALRKKLADLQVHLIRQSVPAIVKQIEELKIKACDELKSIGTVVTTDRDRRRVFSQACTDSLQHLQQELRSPKVTLNPTGDDDHASAAMSWTSLQCTREEAFRDAILQTRLNNIDTLTIGTAVLVTVDGEEEKGTIDSFVGDDRVTVKPDKIEGSKLLKIEGSLNPVRTSQKIGHVENVIGSTTRVISTSLGIFDKVIKPFGLNCVRPDPDWLKQLIKRNRTPDIPCFLNSSLFNAVVSTLIEDEVKPLCTKLLQGTADSYKALLLNTIQKSASGPFSALTAEMLEFVKQSYAKILMQIESRLHGSLSMDKVPFTQNHYLFENIVKKRNEPLLAMLSSLAKPCQSAENFNEVAKAAICAADANKSIDDHVAFEMQIVLASYGKVASKRFIDIVPMMVRDMVREGPNVFLNLADNFTDADLTVLMEQDQYFVRQVEDLQLKCAQLEKALGACTSVLRGVDIKV